MTTTTATAADPTVLDAVARLCEDAALTRPAQVRAALEALAPDTAIWLHDPRGTPPDGPFATVAQTLWAFEVADTIAATLTAARHAAARSDAVRHLFAARTLHIDYTTIPTTSAGLQQVATRTGLWTRAWAHNMMWHAVGEPAAVVGYLNRLADTGRLRVSSRHQRLLHAIVNQVIAADPHRVDELVAVLVKFGPLGDDAMHALRPREVSVDVGEPPARGATFADLLGAAVVSAGTLTAAAWDAVKAAGPHAAVRVIVAVRDGQVTVAAGIRSVEQPAMPTWNLMDAALWAAAQPGPLCVLADADRYRDPARRVAVAAGVRAPCLEVTSAELAAVAATSPRTSTNRPNNASRGDVEVLLRAVPDALFAVVAADVADICDLADACATRPPSTIDALCDRAATIDPAMVASLMIHGSSRWMTGPAAELLHARCGRAYASTVNVGVLRDGSHHRLDGAARYVCDQLGTSRVAWQLFVRLAGDTSAERPLDEYLDACVDIAAR